MKKIVSVVLTVIMLFSMLPMSTFAADLNEVKITVDSVDATAGDTVSVNVRLANNPGIVSANINVAFDEGLTLVGASNGDVFPITMSFIPPKQLSTVGKITGNCNFAWQGADIADSDIKDGVILTLRFEVDAEAEIGDTYNITISARNNDIVDKNLHVIDLKPVTAKITVIDYTPGDVNDDGSISMLDTVLVSRYIVDGCMYDPNGYAIHINEKAADVNDDAGISMLDTVLLSRYIVDGCKTDPNGYNITLKASTKKCEHDMQVTEAKEATCTENGNIAYWYCSLCDKYFADANGSRVITVDDTVIEAKGHTVVIDPAVPATYDSTGLTEGSHCDVCGEVIVKQEVIEKLQAEQYGINYDIANGDTYLASLEIDNPNPDYYTSEKGLTLKNPSVPGYTFLGWYDLPSGNNAEVVKRIAAGEKEDYQLYAHWEKIEYTVTYNSDIFIEKNKDTYTVDEGCALPTPKLSNYTFTGWSDGDGNLYQSRKLPVGTTGNISLDANWTSERNKTFTKPKLDAPIVVEDEENNNIFFTYEIGEIQNVPIYTVHDFGYIAGGGITKTETKTYKSTVTDTAMEEFAKSVSNATTKSSSWTLSRDWNKSTYINYENYKETGLTKEEIDNIAKSETDTWNISSGTSGSKSVASTSTNSSGWSSDSKISDTSRNEDNNGSHTNEYVNNDFKVDAGVGYEAVLGPGKLNAKLDVGFERGWGSSTDKEEWHSDISTHSADFNDSKYEDNSSSSSSSSSSSWNSSQSKGNSVTNSSSRTVSNAITEKIAETYGYGETIDTHEGNVETTGVAATENVSNEYAASIIYSKEVSDEVTSTWTTKDTKSGYHRWILTGKVHVFAVVGYDMSNETYSVYTFGVMDDSSPKEFEDYSNVSGDYNDHENGVIPFEIPFDVEKYVLERTCYSDGLKVDQTTGIITGYSGTDKYVIIPEYMNVGNGDVIKITGISENAFKNNTQIEIVKLSNFITEIPANAFANCTSLRGLLGGSITKIGKESFKNCTSIETCCLDSQIKSLGINAFAGCDRLLVNADNSDVAKSAGQSGAKKIQLYVNSGTIDNTNVMLKDVTLTIPKATEMFSFTGYGSRYPGLRIVSDAKETVIIKAGFDVVGNIPLKLSSSNVVLNQVDVKSDLCGLMMTSDTTNLLMQSTVNIDTDFDMSVLCKNLNLGEYNEKVDGVLDVSGKIYVSGDITKKDLLARKGEEIKYINSDEWNDVLSSSVLVLNAGGGSCEKSAIIAQSGNPVGELPIPTMPGNTFAGWYTADGTEITEDTVLPSGTNTTAYAKWDINVYLVKWNEHPGYNVNVERVSSSNKNAELGKIVNGSGVYYGDVLSVEYSSNEGFDLIEHGETTIEVTNDINSNSIYAVVEAKKYNLTWYAASGCWVIANRTSSPYKNAPTGRLSYGADIYYGDTLSFSYVPDENYKITSSGKTYITVTGNVDHNEVYAAAELNKVYVDTINGYDSQFGRMNAHIDIYIVGGNKLYLKGWIYDKNHPNDVANVVVDFDRVHPANLASPNCPVGGNHGIDWIVENKDKSGYNRIMILSNLIGDGNAVGLWDHWVYSHNGAIGA